MIERIVRQLLRDSEDVRNHVGSAIYAGFAPAKQDGPYIVLRRMSHDREYSLHNEVELVASTLQVDCWDATPVRTIELFELVRNRLSGFRGSVEVVSHDGSIETAHVNSAKIVRDDMQYFEPRDASDKWTVVYSADFRVIHTQTVPTHL